MADVSVLRIGALTALLFLGSCTTVPEIFQPAPTDPNDGYEGSLAEAGVNTDMDWGPKQSLLLSQYTALREQHSRTIRDYEKLEAENQNVKAMLRSEQEALDGERAERVQIEAQVELMRQRLSEQEATILSLRIDKAKAEQSALLAKIDALKVAIDQAAPASVEAAAMPPAGR